MDNSGTTDEAGRWLSYAELAELRGITRKAAIRLTQRHRWRRQPGNDGATRVFVPTDIASRQTPRDDGTPDDFRGKALAVLEAALIEANKRAEAAQVMVERTLAELAGERQRADTLRDRLDDVQRDLKASEAIAHELRADLDAARAQAQASQEVANAQARLMAARRSLGLLARLRAAVRGE